jgi:hypothetical protein
VGRDRKRYSGSRDVCFVFKRVKMRGISLKEISPSIKRMLLNE